jgi:tRNA pseudouridine32 synthase / 23S rRNA pseudouridine746 synthase
VPEPLLTIVHRTERYVVIDKPPGLLSVPGKGEANRDCASERLRTLIPAATGPVVVHRLDMDTSGLLVLALDPDAQRNLSMQFEARTVAKRYIALVDGVLPAESGVIDVPMRADIDRRPVQIVDTRDGRPSLTRWRLLSVEMGRSRLELEPLTGRTHQLRVHLAHIGHPILGDVLYGPRRFHADGADRLCLHAAMLEFDEPGSGARVRFESRPPF